MFTNKSLILIINDEYFDGLKSCDSIFDSDLLYIKCDCVGWKCQDRREHIEFSVFCGFWKDWTSVFEKPDFSFVFKKV